MGERLAGKKALVTGAAQGLGAAIAAMLAREGAKVALADLNLPGAQWVAASIDAECGADATAWPIVVADAAGAMGGLSVLVNNAGIAPTGSIESLPIEMWHKAMQVNVDSVFLGSRAALAVMRTHQPGSIINISSIAGLIASHAFAGYNASKAAVWMLTKSIALHCAHEGLDIRCNSVHPTFIDTPLLDGLARPGQEQDIRPKLARQVPLGRIGQPDDVAYAVVYLASDESRMMTGSELKLDGGISAM
jgi:NAD(P)-dependent dehydrogenase (short-subunit alcohol dehydrogenase family)